MRRSVSVLLLWLLILSICSWQALQTPIITDLTLFIPKTGTKAALLLEELRTGPAARLILIGLEGGSVQTRASTSKRLARQLRETGLFTRVSNGAEPLPEQALHTLFFYRYLLSPKITRERFTEPGLRAALQQRLRELRSPMSVWEKRLLPEDPTGELLILLPLWQAGSEQLDQRFGVWFSAGGKRALLLAETKASGYALEEQTQAVLSIQQAFIAVREATDIELLLSGPGVLATLSRDIIRSEAVQLSTAASILMVLWLALAYRSTRLVLLSLLPLISAVLVAMAVVGLWFGGIHGITLAFGTTLLGVAIDYPIHLFSHLDVRETVGQSLQRIWPTLRLGVLTTVIGYLAMITTAFTGLTQLSIFSIAGLLTAAAVTRWVLPALLPSVWVAPHTVVHRLPMPVLLRPQRTVAIAVSVAGLLLLLGLVVTAPSLWQDDIAALSPVPRTLLDQDRVLRADLKAPEVGHLIVIHAVDAETALRRSERVVEYLQSAVEQDTLSGFDAPSLYLPSRQTQRRRQMELPEPQRLRADLDKALTGLPFRSGLFEPFLKDVARMRTEALLRPQDLNGTALGLRLESLLFPSDRGWTALVPLTGIRNPQQLATGLARQDEENIYYLDMRAETNRLVAAFRDAALLRLGWGAILLVLVLWLALRAWQRMLAVLVPVCLAVIADISLLLWLGEKLSLFHLISLLLVVGIGIDYGLFFSRSETDVANRQRTLHSLFICSSSTIVVFGMLALSTLPVLNAIGQTVAIGVFASFLFAFTVAQQVSKRTS